MSFWKTIAQTDMPGKKKENTGRGIDIAPDLKHVQIWFSQNGASDNMANEFYRYFQKNRWKGKKGKVIRDWKMYAWHWIWDRR